MGKSRIPDTFYIYQNESYDIDLSVTNKSERKRYKVVNRESFAPYYLLMKKIKVIRWTLITLVFISAIIAISTAIFSDGSQVGMDKRTGIVVDDQIRYVKNDVKFMDVKEAGIDTSKVKDGDEISMYFEYDELVTARISADEETESRKETLIVLAACLGCPVIIVFIAIYFCRFNLNDFDSGVYGYLKYDDSIRLIHLCVPCRNDGSLMESRMEQKILAGIQKRKKYRIGITRAEGTVRIPSTGKDTIQRLWILNNERYYDDIFKSGK